MRISQFLKVCFSNYLVLVFLLDSKIIYSQEISSINTVSPRQEVKENITSCQLFGHRIFMTSSDILQTMYRNCETLLLSQRPYKLKTVIIFFIYEKKMQESIKLAVMIQFILALMNFSI